MKKAKRTNKMPACLLAVILVMCLFTSCFTNVTNSERNVQELPRYGVFIGLNPSEMDMLFEYDIVVIDAEYYTKDEIDELRREGIVVYSYLNVGSLEDFRGFYAEYEHLIIGEYEDWQGEYWVNVADEAWQQHIERQAESLVLKGIDGFFIDNVDVYYYYQTPEVFEGLVTILNSLSMRNKDIIINGGDVFIAEAVLDAETPLVTITGVNQECVFTNIDFENNRLVLQDADTQEYYMEYVEACGNAGLAVYLLEYANPEKNTTIALEIEKYCIEQKFNYYIAPTIELV